MSQHMSQCAVSGYKHQVGQEQETMLPCDVKCKGAKSNSITGAHYRQQAVEHTFVSSITAHMMRVLRIAFRSVSRVSCEPGWSAPATSCPTPGKSRESAGHKASVEPPSSSSHKAML